MALDTTKTLTGVTYNGTAFPMPEPTGTRTVNANGTYDVKDYAQVTVAIPVYDGSVS